jgi:hypothetical protein
MPEEGTVMSLNGTESFARDRSEDMTFGEGLTEHEKYLFDLKGYIVVKNALTQEQVEDARARLAQRMQRRKELMGSAAKGNKNDKKIPAGFEKETHLGSDRTHVAASADGPQDAWGANSLVELGGVFVDLIDLPTIAPKLRSLFGDAPYRMDHDYINVLGVDAKPGGTLFLHGGGQGAGGPSDLVGPTDGGQCYYRYSNGKLFNGLIAVAFEFETIQPGDGGFACVPGSHKANVELPSDWKMSATQEEVPDCVDVVAAQPGDAIIFVRDFHV